MIDIKTLKQYPLSFSLLEKWVDIYGFEESYAISSYGRVKSKKRITYRNGTERVISERILSHNTKHGQYQNVSLRLNNKQYTKTIHRLVATHFIDNPNGYDQINHIDGNKSNNHVDNLEWCDSKHNMNHAFKQKLIDITKDTFQFDKNGNLIGIYESIKDASVKTGICESSISECMSGKRPIAGGFLWSKYKHSSKYIGRVNTPRDILDSETGELYKSKRELCQKFKFSQTKLDRLIKNKDRFMVVGEYVLTKNNKN